MAEVVGSIASEEGCVATAVDARRFVKDPADPRSWMPCRAQTYAAPASYTLHSLFGPPEFDWKKLADEPVRFNCRDDGLQLLADPVLVEDISFAAPPRGDVAKTEVSFTVDPERLQANELAFYREYKNGRLSSGESALRAAAAARSVSGFALWPRLILREGYGGADPIVVETREFPTGGHRRSHWQTVLPIGAERPIGGLRGGDRIEAAMEFRRPTGRVDNTASYTLDGKVYPSGTKAMSDEGKV